MNFLTKKTKGKGILRLKIGDLATIFNDINNWHSHCTFIKGDF